MFENKRVREFAAFAAELKGVNVELKEIPALGGLACVCSLDDTMVAAYRPSGQYWNMQLSGLDRRGKKTRERGLSQMKVGLHYEYLAVFMLFCLTTLGAEQLEVEDDELVPTDAAYDHGSRKTASQWEEFMENWQFCMFHIYAKANNMVPALPGNDASDYQNSNDFAAGCWRDLGIDPKLTSYFLSTVYSRE